MVHAIERQLIVIHILFKQQTLTDSADSEQVKITQELCVWAQKNWEVALAAAEMLRHNW